MHPRPLLVAALAAATLGGCTSVKMTYRDQCWVRRAESFGGKVVENVGPCSRPTPPWSSDPFLRLVQECVAESDYRWQNVALDAWSHNEQIPDEPDHKRLVEKCLEMAGQHFAVNEAARREAEELRGRNAVLAAKNDALQERLDELSTETREAARRAEENYDRLARRADESYERLSETAGEVIERMAGANDKLAGYLGEAAKKPAGTAVATATARGEGTAKSDTDSDTRLSSSEKSERVERRERRAAPPPRPAAAPRPASLHTPASCAPSKECVQIPAQVPPAGTPIPTATTPDATTTSNPATASSAAEPPAAGDDVRAAQPPASHRTCEGPDCQSSAPAP